MGGIDQFIIVLTTLLLLVGGLGHGFYFSIIHGMSSSQLTFIFFSEVYIHVCEWSTPCRLQSQLRSLRSAFNGKVGTLTFIFLYIFRRASEGLKPPTKFSYLVGFHPLLPSNVISSMAGKSDIACFDDLILSIHLIEVINGGSVNHNRSIDGFTLWLFNIAGLPGFTY